VGCGFCLPASEVVYNILCAFPVVVYAGVFDSAVDVEDSVVFHVVFHGISVRLL